MRRMGVGGRRGQMKRKRRGWSRIAAKEVEEEGRREKEEGARLCCGLANTRRCLDTLAPETYSRHQRMESRCWMNSASDELTIR